jgi:ribonucleotide reductase alpha subunit
MTNKFKTQEDYLKEIAEKINNGRKYEIENPTIKDIEKLRDFDYIITEAKYFPVIIRKRYTINTVLNLFPIPLFL